MKKFHGFIFIFFSFQFAWAQKENLISIFKEGEIGGHIRTYYMNTLHDEGKDYYADAIGGLIQYETKPYKGFRLGVAGIFTYKIFSNELNSPDENTGKIAKWEHELFDVNDMENFKNLDRLEELFIRYNWKNSYITYGKIPIEFTPLMNKSDGRMKAFAFQGGWLHHQTDFMEIDAGWIHEVSPRSMTEWFRMDEAIGLNSNGFQPDGSLAEYHEFTPSSGAGILHLGSEKNNWKMDFWNIYLDKFLNTSWLQLEYHRPHWELGAIYSYQIPDSYQKKLAYENRYVQPGENGQTLSLMGKYRISGLELKAAFSQAFSSGRYLFPKELGRDQFYTSIPRSRIEGLGDVQVVTVGIHSGWGNWKFDVDATSIFGVETENFEFNKYNIDDYYQINSHLHYGFSGFLEGLNMDLLYVWKENKHNHEPETAYQTSDYNQINLITSFNF